jgi:hypothetical protein
MKPAYMQMVGMVGLTQSVRRTFGWALRLMFGKIERLVVPPQRRFPSAASPATSRRTRRSEISVRATRTHAAALPILSAS